MRLVISKFLRGGRDSLESVCFFFFFPPSLVDLEQSGAIQRDMSFSDTDLGCVFFFLFQQEMTTLSSLIRV